MSENPYIPFYPSDWLAGTRGLTAAETGVYITLIAMMYEREAPLNMDRKRLARLCGTTSQTFNAALDVLIDEKKILDTENGLWNKRAETECKKRAEKSYRAAESANARWQKDKQNQQSEDADAMQSQCDGNANQNQNQNQSINKGTNVPLSEAAEAVRIYNDVAPDVGWPSVQKMTPNRTKMLKARMKAVGGLEGWRHAVERAAQSDFLCGRTQNPWSGFGFDWLVKQANFTKLMEGNYDNREQSSGSLRAIADAARAF